jgi:hypothetical protein
VTLQNCVYFYCISQHLYINTLRHGPSKRYYGKGPQQFLWDFRGPHVEKIIISSIYITAEITV